MTSQLNLRSIIKIIINHHPSSDLVTENRREDMALSLSQFVDNAINKYYRGQREHGGDICDRDLDAELNDEWLDIFWYSEAMKWKAKE